MNALILDDLKNLILQKIGIRVLSPSDCQIIALEISRKVRKNISETTIKRLFGFAAIHHQFSKFTINTLLEYVNDGAINLGINEAHAINLPHSSEFTFIRNKAKNLTEQTISLIVQSCNIPYSLTIERKFAAHDFDYFYNSGFSFTVFIGQSGYGKSILLSHLINRHFLKEESKYKNDVVLFLHVDKIFDSEPDPQDLVSDIQKMLGLGSDKNLISYFDECYRNNGIKLVIILDGFYDFIQKSKNKTKIFDSILQLLCDIEDSKSIKVVLSMRPYIWRRFFETIRHSHFLKSKWFKGSYYRNNDQSNIPFFTDSEVDMVLAKINGQYGIPINQQLRTYFKHPFHLSHYHQLRDEFPKISTHINVIFYESTLKYLLQRIYQSKHADEKLTLCKRLISVNNYGKNGDKVDKNLLLAELKLYRDAYMELILDGILAEEQSIENGFLVERVNFVQSYVFEYFLFKEIWELHLHQMNKPFFDFILNGAYVDEIQLNLLKWSIFQLVKNQEFDEIKHILLLKLKAKEHTSLLLFLAENIQHQINIEPETTAILATSSIHYDILENLIYFDFLNAAYRQILTILSSITTDRTIFSIYQSILCIFDCFTFDTQALSQRIAQLREVTFNNKWYINPLEFSEYLLLKLTGRSSDNHPVAKKITNFKGFNFQNIADDTTENLIKQVTSFFIVTSNWIFNEASKTVEVLKSIHYSITSHQYKSRPYTVYLLHVMALSAAIVGDNKKTTQLERIVGHLHFHDYNTSQSKWLKNLFQLITAYQHYNRCDYGMAINMAAECLNGFKHTQSIALEIKTYRLFIDIYTALNDINKVNEYRMMTIDLLDRHNLHTHLFDISINDRMRAINRPTLNYN